MPSFNSQIAKVQSIVFHLSGQLGASSAGIAAWIARQKVAIVSVSAIVQAKGGTQGTSTVDVLNATTSILSAPIDLTGTVKTRLEGSVVTTSGNAGSVFAAGDELKVNVVISGGSSPTLDNITVQIDYFPL